ncbi:MAG: penicillin-binding protein [Firmicutes bacterium]|nr:penicillin-binding protein [Bacillota bacterium]
MKKTSLLRLILKSVFGAILLAFLMGVIILSLVLEPSIRLHGFSNLNSSKLEAKRINTVYLDSKGEEIFSSRNFRYAFLDDVPHDVKNAFIAIEDKRFYEHDGIDKTSVLRALYQNMKKNSYSQGGSTISQQLIKNTHLTGEKKLKRKLDEARLSVALERKYSKEEILEIYLNALYFAPGIYGAGTASRAFFGKEIDEINLSEGALLASIINNPSRYNPYFNLDNALKRRDLVLGQMKKQGFINESNYIEAKNFEIEIKNISSIHSHYLNYVRHNAAKILKISESDVARRGVIVKTNLRQDIQFDNFKSFEDNIFENDTVYKVIIICNLTGDIVNVFSNSKRNITNLKRQPGSTLKPVLCYAPAIERKIALPITPIKDSPMTFGEYKPRNYRGQYEGWTTVKESLANSSNIVAVRLLEMVGVNSAKKYAKAAGVNFAQSDNSLVIALGGLRYGNTLTEIAGSYLPFANDGKFISPCVIESIKTHDGKYLYKREKTEKQVFSPSTAFLMREMLFECAKNGTAKKLNEFDEVGAKTGTVGSQLGNTDAYSIAFNPNFTIAVHLGGYEWNDTRNITGGGVATEMVREILRILTPLVTNEFETPDSIVQKSIDMREHTKNHKIVFANDKTPIRNRGYAYFVA